MGKQKLLGGWNGSRSRSLTVCVATPNPGTIPTTASVSPALGPFSFGQRNPPVRAGFAIFNLLDQSPLPILNLAVNREADIGGRSSSRLLARDVASRILHRNPLGCRRLRQLDGCQFYNATMFILSRRLVPFGRLRCCLICRQLRRP